MTSPRDSGNARGTPHPDSNLRVLHVNDIAGVASAAVAQANTDGLPWRLWPLPPVRGEAMPVKLWRRTRDLVAFHPAGRSADIVHVHYGLFGYYAWSVRRPYVLHLHGTDVRDNLRSRVLRPVVLAAIRRAGAVAYSTPDLADAVHVERPDAVWLPAPISPSLADRPRDYGMAPERAAAPRIAFASRWDPVKGLDQHLELAAMLRRTYPDAELVGIDWGVGASRAASLGVRLRPLMPPDQFREFLAGSDIVIGQLGSGALGVADLESMALGRPLVARFTQAHAYGDAPDLWNTEHGDPAALVAQILAGPAATRERCENAESWTVRHHGARAFMGAVMPLYRTVVQSGSRFVRQ